MGDTLDILCIFDWNRDITRGKFKQKKLVIFEAQINHLEVAEGINLLKIRQSKDVLTLLWPNILTA